MTTGTWVLPDGPLDCALLGAALCLMHALRGDAVRWWLATGVCAGLALFAKYSAILTIAGALLYLLSSPRHRHWLLRPAPYLAALIALLVFAPVLVWNATHGWASFAFQGARAGGEQMRPFAPFVTLGGEALFVLPWIWLPMMAVFIAAVRCGPAEWRSWLLCCLAVPPILTFALISAWSSQRVLFHWAAPGYLMLFPLLGDAAARRIDRPIVRRLLWGTAAFVVGAVLIVAAEVRFGWLHPAIAAIARRDPTIEAIDWTSLRDDLASRGLLHAGTVVGVANWRDAGKIAYALGPDVTTLCLNRDCRQLAIAFPPRDHIGADVLILAPDHADRVRDELSPLFDDIEPLPTITIRRAGRTLQQASVFLGHGLRGWPPP